MLNFTLTTVIPHLELLEGTCMGTEKEKQLSVALCEWGIFLGLGELDLFIHIKLFEGLD